MAFTFSHVCCRLQSIRDLCFCVRWRFCLRDNRFFCLLCFGFILSLFLYSRVLADIPGSEGLYYQKEVVGHVANALYDYICRPYNTTTTFEPCFVCPALFFVFLQDHSVGCHGFLLPIRLEESRHCLDSLLILLLL